MTKKELTEYKKKYHRFRHHAWAGLGFLSVMLVIRLLNEELSDIITPILVILIIYIVIALLFTYRYSAGLAAEQQTIQQLKDTTDSVEKEKIQSKIKKKKLKAELKTKKK